VHTCSLTKIRLPRTAYVSRPFTKSCSNSKIFSQSAAAPCLIMSYLISVHLADPVEKSAKISFSLDSDGILYTTRLYSGDFLSSFIEARLRPFIESCI